jgi:hypothetical protein
MQAKFLLRYKETHNYNIILALSEKEKVWQLTFGMSQKTLAQTFVTT